MKKSIAAVFVAAFLVVALTILFQKVFAGPRSYNQVAHQVVALINARDYAALGELFNKEMSQALPPQKAAEFFRGLSGQVGKIQKLDEPMLNDGWTIFPAHCERGKLDMSLVLDEKSKIAGLKFILPNADTGQAVTKVANRLVELINAADYPGVGKLFNREMSQALPPGKADGFFKGLTAQVGRIQKLGEPISNAGWTVFHADCERGALEMSLALDGQGRIAGLNFKPFGR